LAPSGVGQYLFSRPGELLRCPWHGWEFAIQTGQSWFDPGKLRVRSYEVTVAAGADLLADPTAPAPGLIKGPYVAETYPVTVEHDYILVEVQS
jgi:3-phenylpropionate/trans-cinnamate dioxygenase ferredoxin subunit